MCRIFNRQKKPANGPKTGSNGKDLKVKEDFFLKGKYYAKYEDGTYNTVTHQQYIDAKRHKQHRIELGWDKPVDWVDSYKIGERDGQKNITCTDCGLTSFHPKDVQYKYCGNCHKFHE